MEWICQLLISIHSIKKKTDFSRLRNICILISDENERWYIGDMAHLDGLFACRPRFAGVWFNAKLWRQKIDYDIYLSRCEMPSSQSGSIRVGQHRWPFVPGRAKRNERISCEISLAFSLQSLDVVSSGDSFGRLWFKTAFGNGFVWYICFWRFYWKTRQRKRWENKPIHRPFLHCSSQFDFCWKMARKNTSDELWNWPARVDIQTDTDNLPSDDPGFCNGSISLAGRPACIRLRRDQQTRRNCNNCNAQRHLELRWNIRSHTNASEITESFENVSVSSLRFPSVWRCPVPLHTLPQPLCRYPSNRTRPPRLRSTNETPPSAKHSAIAII